MAFKHILLLATCVAVGVIHTGSALKCYTKCTERSGNLTAAKEHDGVRDAPDTPCLNKESAECSGYCTRETYISYKPTSFEINQQGCGGHYLGCDRTDSWSHDGIRSARKTVCSCNSTDNCNGATQANGRPLLFVVLTTACGGVLSRGY